MIIEEYDESLFKQRFENYDRVGEGKNFSYAGLSALFEYLDEVSDEENPYKLDVIALCCEFSEYDSIEEYLNDYSNQHDPKGEDEDEEEFNSRIFEEISDNTTLISIEEHGNNDGSFIIQSY